MKIGRTKKIFYSAIAGAGLRHLLQRRDVLGSGGEVVQAAVQPPPRLRMHSVGYVDAHRTVPKVDLCKPVAGCLHVVCF